MTACVDRTYPPWLDDRALSDASRLDRWGIFGQDPNSAYRDATSAHQAVLPARSSGASSRYAAIMAARREFDQKCKEVLSNEKMPPGPNRN